MMSHHERLKLLLILSIAACGLSTIANVALGQASVEPHVLVIYTDELAARALHQCEAFELGCCRWYASQPTR